MTNTTFSLSEKDVGGSLLCSSFCISTVQHAFPSYVLLGSGWHHVSYHQHSGVCAHTHGSHVTAAIQILQMLFGKYKQCLAGHKLLSANPQMFIKPPEFSPLVERSSFPVLQVGNLFGSRRFTIITLYNGAFDSSSALLLVIKVGLREPNPRRGLGTHSLCLSLLPPHSCYTSLASPSPLLSSSSPPAGSSTCSGRSCCCPRSSSPIRCPTATHTGTNSTEQHIPNRLFPLRVFHTTDVLKSWRCKCARCHLFLRFICVGWKEDETAGVCQLQLQDKTPDCG